MATGPDPPDDRAVLPRAVPLAGPAGAGHLIVAGRAIGGDRFSHAAVRSMMCCAVSGQGAGVAAAVSIREGVPAADVSIAKVRAELARQGVRLD